MKRNTKSRRRIKNKKKRLARIIVKSTMFTFVLGCTFTALFLTIYLCRYSDNVLISEAITLATSLLVSKEDFTIVIDPGHGGKDQGTSYESILEKDLNLKISMLLADDLKAKGYKVKLTRETDEFIELPDRVTFAKNNSADLFISIHCNYNEGSTQIKGFETHYYADYSPGMEYAQNIISYIENNSEITTRSAIKSDFHVLRNASVPAVLIETGYLSNSEDRSNLTNDKYLRELSKQMADSIRDSIQSVQSE